MPHPRSLTPPDGTLPVAADPTDRADLAERDGLRSPLRYPHPSPPLHPLPLPPALGGTRQLIAAGRDRIAVYRDGPPDGTPLLLVHSVNAAGSAAEMRPVFEHYATRRPVYALDLPGFGASGRDGHDYTPRRMTDALLALRAEITRRHGNGPIDAMALSLGCEFLARAAVERPADFGRLAFVSPTGFERGERHFGPPGRTRERRWLHRLLAAPLWARGLYGLLVRPGVIRYFLERTWGSPAIDETLYRYNLVTTRQPGAERAPLAFLAGQPFSADINRIYDKLVQPVWIAHGTRGDFVHFEGAARLLQARRHWQAAPFDTGAMPYFERPRDFIAQFDAFLQRAALPPGARA